MHSVCQRGLALSATESSHTKKHTSATGDVEYLAAPQKWVRSRNLVFDGADSRT